VSFLPTNGAQLPELIQSARSDGEVEDRLKWQASWMLIQAVAGKASATHVMIDAGMPPRQAKNLPLAAKGIKLVFSQRTDHAAVGNRPFEARARWRPVFIAELDGRSISHVLDLPAKLFQGNPVMPIF
jgi:hypothetical protein